MLFALWGMEAMAHSSNDRFADDSVLKNANISLLVKELGTDKIMDSYNADNSFVPASTMKLLTTATFLEKKGADYQFATTLEYDGIITQTGVLQGNLYIRGAYDPTLGSEKMGDRYFLDKWVANIKAFGIRRIEGDIVILSAQNDRMPLNAKWLWEDIGNYYAAGTQRIAYKDNTYRLTLESGALGTTPRIVSVTPKIPNLTFENYLTSTNTKSDKAYIYGSPYDNLRKIVGEIPAHRHRFVIRGDMPDPSMMLGRDLAWKLKTAQIMVGNVVKKEDDQLERLLIYTHYSPPLSEIIAEVNTQSNNLYAEQLYRALQEEYGGDVVERYWAKKGVPVDACFQYDGSGLSPVNALSAHFLVALLERMTSSPYWTHFFSSLPQSGKTGTLKTFLAQSPLAGKVFAKSGSFDRVRSYAGYIDVEGRSLVFAIIVNNANGTPYQVKRKIEQLLWNSIYGDKK